MYVTMKKTLSLICYLLITNVIFGINPVLDFHRASSPQYTLIDDTLHVGYTYWWNSSEPIMGIYGRGYALIFTGVVTEISPADDYNDDVIYASQFGTIEIMQVLHSKKLKDASLENQKYFTSDCFYTSGFKKGDTVLVFCFEYEGRYAIPGHRSIVELDGMDDPFLHLIQLYANNNLDKDIITNHLDIWKNKGLVYTLEELYDSNDKD
jgi:hypothetical protein